jgi:hypothetical protein
MLRQMLACGNTQLGALDLDQETLSWQYLKNITILYSCSVVGLKEQA